MRLEIELNGQLHVVDVEPAGGTRFDVRRGDRVQVLDVLRLDVGTFSVRLPDGSTHHLGVERSDGGQRLVSVDGQRVVTVVNGRRAAAGLSGTANGSLRVVAPMPGRVVRVLVAVGDEVQARQPLVVVEAMKMENELSVPRAGRVAEVAVAEGQSVEAGRLLVLVE